MALSTPGAPESFPWATSIYHIEFDRINANSGFLHPKV